MCLAAASQAKQSHTCWNGLPVNGTIHSWRWCAAPPPPLTSFRFGQEVPPPHRHLRTQRPGSQVDAGPQRARSIGVHQLQCHRHDQCRGCQRNVRQLHCGLHRCTQRHCVHHWCEYPQGEGGGKRVDRARPAHDCQPACRGMHAVAGVALPACVAGVPGAPGFTPPCLTQCADPRATQPLALGNPPWRPGPQPALQARASTRLQCVVACATRQPHRRAAPRRAGSAATGRCPTPTRPHAWPAAPPALGWLRGGRGPDRWAAAAASPVAVKSIAV